VLPKSLDESNRATKKCLSHFSHFFPSKAFRQHAVLTCPGASIRMLSRERPVHRFRLHRERSERKHMRSVHYPPMPLPVPVYHTFSRCMQLVGNVARDQPSCPPVGATAGRQCFTLIRPRRPYLSCIATTSSRTEFYPSIDDDCISRKSLRINQFIMRSRKYVRLSPLGTIDAPSF